MSIRLTLSDDQHRAMTRPFFQPVHVNPSHFVPLIKRFLDLLPMDKPFDVQALLGDLTLGLSTLWLTGEDIYNKAEIRTTQWRHARGQLYVSLRDAQNIATTRVRRGFLWVRQAC